MSRKGGRKRRKGHSGGGGGGNAKQGILHKPAIPPWLFYLLVAGFVAAAVYVLWLGVTKPPVR